MKQLLFVELTFKKRSLFLPLIHFLKHLFHLLLHLFENLLMLLLHLHNLLFIILSYFSELFLGDVQTFLRYVVIWLELQIFLFLLLHPSGKLVFFFVCTLSEVFCLGSQRHYLGLEGHLLLLERRHDWVCDCEGRVEELREKELDEVEDEVCWDESLAFFLKKFK